MTPEDLSQLLDLGEEKSGVEFKGCRPRSDLAFMAKVTRAALGMSNRRDGGLIVIGVDEDKDGLHPNGLSNEDLKSWRSDLVADIFAQYADPPLAFTLESVELDTKFFVAISVGEFEDVPTICRRAFSQQGGQVVLREGACYVRPRRKPETTEVPTYPDMRDLLDLALEKHLRRHVMTSLRAGLALVPATQAIDPALESAKLFQAQLEDLK
jgi:predicted HTH transcriptional regulator